jgi:hypothetical protein
VDIISQKALRFFLNTTSPFSKRFTHPQFFRDQFTISTWLALGALCQAALFLLFGRLAFIPALLLILYRTADTFLMAVGVKRNQRIRWRDPEKVLCTAPRYRREFWQHAS